MVFLEEMVLKKYCHQTSENVKLLRNKHAERITFEHIPVIVRYSLCMNYILYCRLFVLLIEFFMSHVIQRTLPVVYSETEYLIPNEPA